MKKEKTCATCKIKLPITTENFREDKRTFDGWSRHCISCKPIKTAYYLNNIDKQKKKQQEWNSNNKEYKINYNRIYKEQNKDTIYAWNDEWQKEHPDRIKENTKSFQKNNPDVIREYNRKRLTKNHRISKIEWENCKEYFDYKCAYCGMREDVHKELFDQGLHREHADAYGSVYLDNCIPSCRRCNSKKRDHHYSEWYTNENPVFKEERLLNIHNWLEHDYKRYMIIRK